MRWNSGATLKKKLYNEGKLETIVKLEITNGRVGAVDVPYEVDALPLWIPPKIDPAP